MDLLAVIQICGLKTPQLSATGIVYCSNQTASLETLFYIYRLCCIIEGCSH